LVPDRVGIDRYSKAVGQLEHAVLDPLPPVLEVLSGSAIKTAEKGAPDAAAYAVEEPRLLVADQLASWIGHAEMLARPIVSGNRSRGLKAVGDFLQIVGVPVLADRVGQSVKRSEGCRRFPTNCGCPGFAPGFPVAA